MFADRREYDLEFAALTPTHVGTGEFAEFTREGSNEPSSVATMARDCDDNPWLPPTALKGMLRREAEARGLAADPGYSPLFGTIRDSRAGMATGAMGLLLMRGASMSKAPPDVAAMPFAGRLKRRDAFVAARTAIDPQTGVAADHKLFLQEMLPAGARFRCKAVLLGHGGGRAEAAGLFDRLLSALMRDGLSIGKSQADGQGELKLVAASVRDLVLTAQGELKERSSGRIAAAAAGQDAPVNVVTSWAASAFCEAPFLVADSSLAKAQRGLDEEFSTARNSGPQISAQRVSERLPLVLGSSISGALMARARWLADRMERRGAIADASEALRELFGAPERRALLGLRELRVSEATPFDITSLRLDRFSGGPVDGALFTTAAFTGTKLAFRLVLERRGDCCAGREAIAVAQTLVEDIGRNGLILGAGTNKGFGWFDAEIAEEAGYGA